ncbi:uncharacterized protein LOC141651327 [Silene latifolia]|uniref:uncharacterized protein LOC141651327 n=1 Tax=Silene latifolia TaxID=37657 RepID=UPI003D77D7C4
MDIGHTTDDYFTLRKEVAYLLKSGYLKDLIRTKGRNGDQSKKNQEQKQDRNLPPPPPIYEVKFISGGSEICGLTSSAAKKIARMPRTTSPCKPDHVPSITFSDCDLVGIPNVHHDGMVISMQIGTAIVRRILGSVEKPESRSTLGEIHLPTYAEGVSSDEKFGVLDCLSSYNAILGRQWIHNVKAVPSTYHQCIKVPADWGIATIKGEHKVA